MAIMGYMGYRKRTGFLAGLTVAQISEFSIVFVAMGITLGHVGAEALGLITLVGLVTITAVHLHDPLLAAALRAARALARPLRAHVPVPRAARSTPAPPTPAEADVIVFGLGRYGSRLLAQLRAAGVAVLGVDFDPEAVATLRASAAPDPLRRRRGPDFLETLPIRTSRAGW